MFRHDNVPTAPFDNISLLLLSEETKITNSEKALLYEFLASVPKISNLTINEYLGKKDIVIPTEKIDISLYLKRYKDNMPKDYGMHSFGIETVIRDSKAEQVQGSNSSLKEVTQEEMECGEQFPNVLRPIPKFEDDIMVDEALWIVPNIIPEVMINMNWLTPDKKYKMLLLKSLNVQLNMEETKDIIAVSYTHLTLPTKRIV